jgi:hypothetical protein
MREDEVIHPTEGESYYEAYHSLFSSLTGEEVIYKTLAIICGANNYKVCQPEEYDENGKYITKMTRTKIDPSKINTIISKKTPDNATHYQYVNYNGEIQDPYETFQLYNSHGNCFLYALYLAFRSNNLKNKANIPNINLNNIRNLLEIKNDDGKHPYYKVKTEYAQLAYQLFVDNDYKIINWGIAIIEKNFNYRIGPNVPTLNEMYNQLWSNPNFWNYMIKIVDKKGKQKTITYRENYNVPENMTFDIFITQLYALVQHKENTYQMTWEQIENWDKQSGTYPPYDNSGIEGATKLINPNDYEINANVYNQIVNNNFIQLLGGNTKISNKLGKTKNRNKSNKKRNKSKSRTRSKIKK